MNVEVGTIVQCRIRRGMGMEGKSDIRPGIVLELQEDEHVLVEVFGYVDNFYDMEEGNDWSSSRYVASFVFDQDQNLWREPSDISLEKWHKEKGL